MPVIPRVPPTHRVFHAATFSVYQRLRREKLAEYFPLTGNERGVAIALLLGIRSDPIRPPLATHSTPIPLSPFHPTNSISRISPQGPRNFVSASFPRPRYRLDSVATRFGITSRIRQTNIGQTVWKAFHEQGEESTGLERIFESSENWNQEGFLGQFRKRKGPLAEDLNLDILNTTRYFSTLSRNEIEAETLNT